MIKTLYNPEVEKGGIKIGIEQGKIEDAENFLKLGVSEEIVSKGTGISIEKVREIKRKLTHYKLFLIGIKK